MRNMRSASDISCCGAFFAVEAGRDVHVETLERTVTYFDSWSGVSLVCAGIFEAENGFGIGTFRGPSVGSLKGSSSGVEEEEVFELVAGSLFDAEWKDSADWNEAALEVGCAFESEGGVKASSLLFSVREPLSATVGFGFSELATSAMMYKSSLLHRSFVSV